MFLNCNMAAIVNTRIVYSILFYILLMILILLAKPSVMFDSDNNIKIFGTGNDKTMFSFGVFSVIVAIISFYIFSMIDLICNK